MSGKTVILFITGILLSLNALAQESRFIWSASADISPRFQKDASLLTSQASVGYRFNPLISGLFTAEIASSPTLFADKNQHLSEAVGALVKCDIYRFDEGLIDIRGGLSRNLSDKQKYINYNLGLYVEAGKYPTKPFIGLTFRYFDRLEKGSKDQPFLCLTTGFVVN